MTTLEATVKHLKKLEENWPSKYWIFAADGRLYLIRKNKNGERAITDFGGVDQDFIVAEFDIESDGGDW